MIRRPTGLTSRLALAMSALIVVTCVALGWMLVQHHIAHIQMLMADRGRSLAEQLARNAELSVLSGDGAALAVLGQQALAQHDVVYYRVADRAGAVLAEAGTPREARFPVAAAGGDTMEPTVVGSEIWEFRAPVMTVVSSRRREEIGLFDEGRDPGHAERVGTVAVGLSLAGLHDLRLRTFLTAMTVIGLLTLAAVGCAVLVARAITQPLTSLVAAAGAFASGDLAARVEVHTADEIGTLGTAFNQMAESVAASHATLERQNRELEEHVRARTARLEALNRELEEANRLKDEFLATVSHELRTPLHVIIGYAEMMADGPLEADQRQVLDGIQRYSKLQLDLITSVLDFGRVSSGQMTFRVERFAAGPLLEELRALFEGQLWQRQLLLRIDTTQDTPLLETDRVKLQEIVRNLVDNAIKFTERGSVTVTARGTPQRDAVVIEVCDTGPGIAPADLEHVFEAFRQMGVSSTRSTGGVGLGLAIARRLTEALGGRVTVESRLGVGTTFRVTVPAKLPAANDASRTGAGVEMRATPG